MTWDPQNAPLYWTKVIGHAVDDEGNPLVLLLDQDGNEWWAEEEDR